MLLKKEEFIKKEVNNKHYLSVDKNSLWVHYCKKLDIPDCVFIHTS